MRNLQSGTMSVIYVLVLAVLAGPYPLFAGPAETVVGLGGRALLTAAVVWLAITLLQPRSRPPEVTR